MRAHARLLSGFAAGGTTRRRRAARLADDTRRVDWMTQVVAVALPAVLRRADVLVTTPFHAGDVKLVAELRANTAALGAATIRPADAHTG